MKKQQSGFTMIELIMVIVILGILAAVALPRFADFSGDAKKATVNGIAGGIRSAASIAHAAQLAKGDSGNTAVVLEGASVAMVEGYPAATDAGITVAAQLQGVVKATASGVMYVAPAGGTATATSDCVVIYQEAQAATTGSPSTPAQPASVTVNDTCAVD